MKQKEKYCTYYLFIVLTVIPSHLHSSKENVHVSYFLKLHICHSIKFYVF